LCYGAGVSDPILIALMRQLLRRQVLTDMDVQAMAADLQREGFDAEEHSVNVAWIEAHLEPDGTVADGGNSDD
jgi:hypothetical protein